MPLTNTDIAASLKKSLSGKSEFTTKEISDALQEHFSSLSPSTIAWRINQLKQDQLLFQTGRGLYTFDFKPHFESELSLKSKRLYNKVKSIYSGEFAIWDTTQLSEIGNVKIDKHWVFLAARKEDLDLLFNQMLMFSKKVFLQPDKETTLRYLIPQEEAVILTTLISETPLDKSTEYLTPSLEAILFNAWYEHDQYLKPIGLNIHNVYKQAFANYKVNKNKLLRYAARRDKRKEINKLLKSIV